MRIKLLLLLFILLIANNIYPQESTIYKIDYDIYYNTDYPMLRKAELFIDIDKDYSIFREDLKKYEWQPSDKKNNLINSADYTMSVAKNINQRYVKNVNSHLILFEDFAKKAYLIKDTFPNFNWQILNNKKIVNDLECVKAIGEYRGRKFEVWFTYEIPLSYGPWKFCGLPGLIVEAKSTDDKYSFIATKIEKKYELIDLPSAENKIVTLKEFINIREEFYNGTLVSSRDTRVERIKMPRGGLELIYEWEEDQDKNN
nr:GLPGLI family protein [uncultured Flavobacterium sp.]